MCLETPEKAEGARAGPQSVQGAEDGRVAIAATIVQEHTEGYMPQTMARASVLGHECSLDFKEAPVTR